MADINVHCEGLIEEGEVKNISQETQAQSNVTGVDGAGPNQIVQKNVTVEDVVTTQLLNSSETSAVGIQTCGGNHSSLEQRVDDSAGTQCLTHGEPTEPLNSRSLGTTSIAPITNVEDLVLSKNVESKGSVKKQDVLVDLESTVEDATTTASLQAPKFSPKYARNSGESGCDKIGHHQNAGHKSESRPTLELKNARNSEESGGDKFGHHQNLGRKSESRPALEPPGEAAPLSQSIHSSKHAPPALEKNYSPHPGAFVQKFEHLPRAPRRHQTGNQQQYDRVDPRDQARTGQAQVRKLQQIIDNERMAHKVELDQAEARARDCCETALQKITSDIFSQYTALVQQTAHLKERELSISAREALALKIEQLLAVGQKQSAGAEADDQELDAFINVNEVIIQERVTHEIRHRDRQVDSQLASKKEELHHREAAIDMREKAYFTMYKAGVAEKLRSEICAELQQAIAAQESSEYDNGFAKGKALGQTEGNEQLRQLWYDKGFAACHSMLGRMKRLQAGLLAGDSPELAFLFDQSHPDNPFTRGLEIGRRDVAAPSQPFPTLAQPDDLMSFSHPANLGAHLDRTTLNGTAVDTATRPHPYAHRIRRANELGNGHENEVDNDGTVREQVAGLVRGLSNGLSMSARPPPRAFSYTEGPTDVYSNTAVPQIGTMTEPTLHSSLQSRVLPMRTPPSNTNATAGDRSDSSIGQPHDEESVFFPSRRQLTYGQARGEDDQMHKADTQVNLIDLY